MKLGEETIEQIKVADYLRYKKIPFFHFPNEGKRGYQNALILKRMGMEPGVLDLFMPRKNHQYSGLWLEMKSQSGHLSPKQLEFTELMVEEGYAVRVAYSSEAAIRTINDFYGIG